MICALFFYCINICICTFYSLLVFFAWVFTETIISLAQRILSNENSEENRKRFYILISPLCFVYTQPQLVKMHPMFTEFRFTQARKTCKKLWVGTPIKKTYTRIHQAVTEHALTQIMEVIDKVLFHFACFLFIFCELTKKYTQKNGRKLFIAPINQKSFKQHKVLQSSHCIKEKQI